MKKSVKLTAKRAKVVKTPHFLSRLFTSRIIGLAVVGILFLAAVPTIHKSFAWTLNGHLIPINFTGVYVADTANAADTNTGLTPDDPVRTLRKAVSIAIAQNAVPVGWVNVMGPRYAVKSSDFYTSQATRINIDNASIIFKSYPTTAQTELYQETYSFNSDLFITSNSVISLRNLWINNFQVGLTGSGAGTLTRAEVLNSHYTSPVSILPSTSGGMQIASTSMNISNNIFDSASNSGGKYFQLALSVKNPKLAQVLNNTFTTPYPDNQVSGDGYGALAVFGFNGQNGSQIPPVTIQGNTFQSSFGQGVQPQPRNDITAISQQGQVNIIAQGNNFGSFLGLPHVIRYNGTTDAAHVTFGS